MGGRYKTWIIFLLACSAAGCATIYNPATERKELIWISTQQEIALGQDMDAQIRKKMEMLRDPRMEARLAGIGARIAKVSDRQEVSYTFRIVKDNAYNAFAIPGGFLYVNSGLMDAADDDELAGVLGHEIGHVAARHSIKKLQAALGYQLLLGLAMGLSGQQTMGKALDIVFEVSSLGYSREDEYLADKLAVRYSSRAGFNPYGMVAFFMKLKDEAKRRGPDFHVEFFSSHPETDKRIQRVKDEISRLNTR